jgi:hypothetical protein
MERDFTAETSGRTTESGVVDVLKLGVPSSEKRIVEPDVLAISAE